MSEDLIKRSDAIRALNREKSDWNCDYNVPIDNCIKRLNKVKPADGRKSGEWIRTRFVDCGSPIDECSICGHYINGDMKVRNFCPNCGAEMR